MTKRRGLGRGLDALLSSSAAAVALGEGSTEEFQTLPLDLVRRSPRLFVARGKYGAYFGLGGTRPGSRA